MIFEFKDLEKIKNEHITFVIGTFDLLHSGHLYFLKKAKEVAPKNKLLVGIISDRIVWEVKGDNRPIIPEKQRAELIDALEVVDLVFIAPEIATGKVAKSVLETVKPEYSVVTKSAWENRENPVEVKDTNLVVIDSEVPGISTTEIFDKVKGKFNYDQPYVVVGALLEKEGEFLLVKELSGPARGLWNIPAGKWDKGESLQKATEREVREETGFDFKAERLIGIFARHKAQGSILQAVFSGTFIEKEASFDREIAEIRWFKKEEIIEMDDKKLRSNAIKDYISDYCAGNNYTVDVLKEIFY